MCIYINFKVGGRKVHRKAYACYHKKRYGIAGCKTFEEFGLKCGDDGIPAKGLNGPPIKLGSTTQKGACERCMPME
jgi:hypothetical protein